MDLSRLVWHFSFTDVVVLVLICVGLVVLMRNGCDY